MSGTSPTRRTGSWPHQRVRRSMYLAFVALAALAVLQAVLAHRFERLRATDASAVKMIDNQRAATQQMGRVAALAAALVAGPAASGAEPAATLARERDNGHASAELADAAVRRKMEQAGSELPGVAQALSAWQRTRDGLLQRCDALLARLTDGTPDDVAAAAAALQQRVEPTVADAGFLSDKLHNAARARSQHQVMLLEGGLVLTLLLLGVLGLFVVEPTARAVQQHMRRLDEQAGELAQLATVAEYTDNHVVITDGERRVLWANAAFTRCTGYTLDEIRGKRPSDLLHSPLNDPTVMANLKAAVQAGQPIRAEVMNNTKSGGVYWLELDLQPLRNAAGEVYRFVSVGTDVTERRALQERLRESSRTDALTGLPNRAVVLDRVQRALLHAARNPGYGFAVLFMDFDRFKQVNDTLGHGAGDVLLRQIGQRIEDTMRPGDAVARVASELHTAARIGGDEFVVVLEGIRSADEARAVAERLLKVLAQPYQIGPHAVQSSASIGIVTADNAAATADDVLRDADTAMYEAKRGGRGRCVVFDAAMQKRVVQALETESDLRRALRDNELFVVYQPVIDLAADAADGNVAAVGVEALVRWRHPTRGLVSPADFIGLAEECGLIDAIGQHVLRSACAQFARWRRELGAAAPREMAVNLSRAQLKLPGLVPEVQRVLEHNGMQPHELQFEVTESLAAQDERVQAALRELKTLGVRLALDDFGTGYSSLACLHQLPVDTVKIDRSFVSHAETVEYHRVLIEATIRVAQTLGMTTVAEGIETAGQAALMRRLHCDRGQGYLFAKPLAADELSRWLLGRARQAEPGAAPQRQPARLRA